MFRLWSVLLGDSFVFLDVGPSILCFVFLFFGGVLVFYKWQGFTILIVVSLIKG
jgi:hypothetical protein